jgi:hypothetical protein
MQSTYRCIAHLEFVGKVLKEEKHMPNTQDTTKQHTKWLLFSHLHMMPLIHPSFP